MAEIHRQQRRVCFTDATVFPGSSLTKALDDLDESTQPGGQKWWHVAPNDPRRLVVMYFRDPIDNGSIDSMPRDTSITVFNKMFHIHSMVLKQRSAFFDKFMDMPEEPAAPEPGSDKFKYEYVSVTDDDGTWGLEARHRASDRDIAIEDRVTLSAGETKGEENRFEMFVCALYRQDYSFRNTSQLISLVKLADFYLAIPAFSASLHKAVKSSPILRQQIRQNREKLIVVAHKLQNQKLFKECYVHCVSLFDPNELNTFLFNENPKIYAIVKEGHERLQIQRRHAYYIFRIAAISERWIMMEYDNFKRNYRLEHSQLEDPPYFRCLVDRMVQLFPQWRYLAPIFKNGIEMLSKLFYKNLEYDMSDDLPGMDGIYKNCFLCADIQHGEYPWQFNDQVV